ncbi:unnamed protein product, partial [Phaeothamnion confervicola]
TYSKNPVLLLNVTISRHGRRPRRITSTAKVDDGWDTILRPYPYLRSFASLFAVLLFSWEGNRSHYSSLSHSLSCHQISNPVANHVRATGPKLVLRGRERISFL